MEEIMQKWECPCGYIYDPAEGDYANGVDPGYSLGRLACRLGMPLVWRRKRCVLEVRRVIKSVLKRAARLFSRLRQLFFCCWLTYLAYRHQTKRFPKPVYCLIVTQNRRLVFSLFKNVAIRHLSVVVSLLCIIS